MKGKAKEDIVNDKKMLSDERIYEVLQTIYSTLTTVCCGVAIVLILIVWRKSKMVIKMVFFLGIHLNILFYYAYSNVTFTVSSQFIIGLIGFLSSPIIGVDFSSMVFLSSAM